MSSPYDKILPTKVYRASGDPYFVPYSGISSIQLANITASNITATNVNTVNANVSSLTAFSGAVSSLNVSSINGYTFPLSVQTSVSNTGTTGSSVSIPTNQWVPLFSTPNTFTFIGGKTYDINVPMGVNVSAAPADAAANIEFGVSHQSQAVPSIGYTIHTAAGQTQTLANGNLRAIINIPTGATLTEPLVASAYIQNASSNATMSYQGTAQAGGSSYMVSQLN